ncbi:MULTISPECIES: type II toxin-antitoxin system RelB/DinJ family antitoxin [unclassified Bifidobacterium]|uniref:type II toxin-antitoxin system RelB/DinJ family antitoxin n=1 Tax=unclassified Bifidobacterium TaxID=2608897 RepID=UPI0023F93B7B|nr:MULTISPECIES: type II toxin-antitoxin system RelB/DinJ family antitoxin [unclassified Bifidobacterium]WEV65579.1 type II toxin-antitoxin system RelB/DinJ family antitoxin [Bifidobacterium sp. ESL0764]WEV75614.1 type II toxin-antitoxin system RelB/DinJ family antitoxin [Bifidobacterium sp. ESL0800]
MAHTAAQQTRIQVRTDKTLKEQAVKVFAGMGIDLSAAINMFLSQAVKEGGMPFRPMSLTPLEKAVRKAENSGFVYAGDADAAQRMIEDV